MKLSIIIPAKNEAGAIEDVVSSVKKAFPEAELIVVNDGSDDNTDYVARKAGACVVSHPLSLGNGAAIKTGVKRASGDVFVFMDGDGQHQACDIEKLIEPLGDGFDLVVGARSKEAQANGGRALANSVFNMFAGYMTGQKIMDLTSGFRAVKADKFREVLYLLPNKFSYPTTSTMAFFRSGYAVKYVGVEVMRRIGSSHISPLRDGFRFLLIIFKVATLYSPLKIFVPLSGVFFLTGFSYYMYTFFMYSRFTNMSMLLFSVSVLVFLIGLVSEQITTLIYK